MNPRSSHQTKFFLLVHFPLLQTAEGEREQRKSIKKSILEKDFLYRFYPCKETWFNNCQRGLNYVPNFFSNRKHLIWVLPTLCSWNMLKSYAPTMFSCLIGDTGLIRKFGVTWVWMRKGRKKGVFEISAVVPRNRSGRRQWGPAGARPAQGWLLRTVDAKRWLDPLLQSS